MEPIADPQFHGDQGDGYVDFVKGANIAGLEKVADAMLTFGVVRQDRGG